MEELQVQELKYYIISPIDPHTQLSALHHSQSTVRVAEADVSPITLDTMQVYCPASSPVTMETTRVGSSAPEIAAPPNSHVIPGGGFPSAMQVNWASLLRGTEILVGGCTMEGGTGEGERTRTYR